MKVRFRCYKCGREFAAEERVRTDICPHCMSFVDLARAERCTDRSADATTGQENVCLDRAAQVSDAQAEIVPDGQARAGVLSALPGANAEEAGRTAVGERSQAGRTVAEGKMHGGRTAADTYESLYNAAEKFMAAGAWSNAAEHFRRSLKLRESWQARFGLVRAATRELTDLRNFSEVQRDADAAFGKMTSAERLALGKRYVPKLEEKRRSLSRSLDALKAQDHFGPPPMRENGFLAEAGNGVGNASAQKKKTGRGTPAIVVCTVIMVVMFMIGTAIVSEEPYGGAIIVFLGLALGVLGIAFGWLANVKEKRANAAAESVDAVVKKSQDAERKSIRAQIDAVDYLCGFFKY